MLKNLKERIDCAITVRDVITPRNEFLVRAGSREGIFIGLLHIYMSFLNDMCLDRRWLLHKNEFDDLIYEFDKPLKILSSNLSDYSRKFELKGQTSSNKIVLGGHGLNGVSLTIETYNPNETKINEADSEIFFLSFDELEKIPLNSKNEHGEGKRFFNTKFYLVLDSKLSDSISISTRSA